MTRTTHTNPGPARCRTKAPAALAAWALAVSFAFAFAAPASAQSVGSSLLESQLQKIRQGQMNARTAATVMAASSTNSGAGNIVPPMPESAAGLTPPTSGGFVPSGFGAPLTDDFGSRLGYCVRGFGGTSGTANIALAVLFAGPDQAFNTNCTQALSGTRAGDDYVTTYSAVSLSTAYSDTTILRVEAITDLDLIPVADRSVGEMRYVKQNNSLYRWDPVDGWQNASGLSQSDLNGGNLDANFKNLTTQTLRITGLAGSTAGRALRVNAAGDVVEGKLQYGTELEGIPTLVQSLGGLPPGGTGILVSTGAGALAMRNVVGEANQLVVSNPDGAANANITVGLATILQVGGGPASSLVGGSGMVSAGTFGGYYVPPPSFIGGPSETVLNIPQVTVDVGGRVTSVVNVPLNITDTLAAWRTDGNVIENTNPVLGSPATGQFLGTKSTSDLVVATNNTVRMVISSAGATSLGGSLSVNGATTIGGQLVVNGFDARINGLTVGRGGGAYLSNTAIGASALGSNSTGQANVAIGQNAMQNSFSGGSNIAIGQNALQNADGWIGNVAIGANAGANVIGGGNLFLGTGVGSGVTNSVNKLYVGNSANNLLYGDFATGRLAINAGATPAAPSGILEVNTSASNTPGLVVVGANGNSGDLLQLQGRNGANLVNVFTASASGGVTINPQGGANPLTIVGVPAGQGSDSLLSIDSSGVVRRRSLSEVTGSFWALGGNNNADANSFVGTLNNVDLAFRTANVERFRISAATGAGTFNGAFSAGSLSTGGSLSVTGNTFLTGLLAANGGVNTPTLTATAVNTTTLNTTGLATLASLQVNGTSTFNGAGAFNAGLTANTLTVNGNAELSGGATVGTTGLVVNGTAGTPNVTLASLGGATANATTPTGFDRVVLANTTGQLNQVSLSNLLASNSWQLLGNAGTNPAINFVGTTDGQPLVFRTANTERFRILANGEGNFTGTLTAGGLTTANAQITGGAINGTPIGAGTASTGAFTSLQATTFAVSGESTLSGGATVGGAGLTVQGTAGTPNVSFASIGGTAAASPTSGFDRFVIASNTGALRQVGIDNLFANRTWLLGGNAITDPNAQYLGSSNNADLVIKTNGAERARFTGAGEARFTAPLVANGGATVSGGLATDTLTASGTSTFGGVATFNGAATFNAGLTAGGSGISTNTLAASTSVTTPLVTNAGTLTLSGTGNAGTLVLRTGAGAGTERLRVTAGGNVGIGTNDPQYALDVFAAANPLRLQGLQTGTTADDLLSVDANGVVRKRNLGDITGSFWTLTGNSNVTADNFLGTTIDVPLVFKTNNETRFTISSTGAGSFAGPLTVNNTLTANTVATANAQITGGAIAGTAITGGSINGTPIGATTAASGRFTTLTSTQAATLDSLAVTNGATVGGTLGVTGASTFAGLLTANGGIATTTLTASGAATLDSLAVTNNATVGGTFGVTGNTALGGTLAVTGASTFTGAVTVNNTLTANTISTANAQITGGAISGTAITGGSINGTPIGATTASTGRFTTLTSTGAATLDSLGVTNNATVGGTLGVTGVTTLTGGATVGTAGLTVQGTALSAGGPANVVLSSLGGDAAASLGSYDRIVLANTSGALGQASLSAVVGSQAWLLGGNAGTTSSNFLGTTDTRSLVFKTNSATRFTIDGSTGAGTFAGPLTVNNTLTANTVATANAQITGGSINGTPIGATTPSTGVFTTLTSTGAATLDSLGVTGASTFTGAVTVNNTLTANTISTANAQITGGAISGTAITGGSINNTPIGATTAASGRFTTLTSTGVATLDSLGVTNNATVGGTLGVTGVTTLTNLGGAVNATMPSASFDRVIIADNTGRLSQVAASQLLNDNVWLTTGNTGITSSNFLGTTDTQSLVFKTNSATRFTIDGATGAGTFVGALNVNNTLTANTVATANAQITGGSINGTPIGATTPSTGRFTTLATTSVATLNSLAVTNGATVGGTLGVTGPSTFTGLLTANGGIATTTLTTSGAATLDSLAVTNGATVGGDLAVTGATSLSGGATVTNGLATDTLTVSGTSTFADAATFNNAAATFNAGLTSTSVTTPLVTNDGTLTLSGTGSAGTLVLRTGAGADTERLRITSGGLVGIATGATTPGARLQVNTGVAGTKGFIVRGFTGQTANLFEAQNSGGTVLASISSSGAGSFAGLNSTGSLTVTGASTLTGGATVGSTGLTVNGTAGTPNVTLASLGSDVNTTMPADFDRVIIADNAGRLSQVAASQLLNDNVWLTTGNTGTTSSNFLGTTDTQSLVFKTNSATRFTIDGSTGAGTFVGALNVNNTLTANTVATANAQITGGAISGTTISSSTITGGSINNTPIGATTANTGRFTTLETTSIAGIGAAPTAGTQLQITAANGNRGLVVRAAGSSPGNIFEARNAAGTAQVTIGSTGAFSTEQDITVNGLTVGRGAGGVSSNTAVGASALVNNGSIIPSTATNSVAIGTGAFRFLSQGADNVAVGVDAGSYETLVPIDTAVDRSSSIFIGARSFGPAASSNQIVIGTEAAGLGSNSAVLGNSNITATRLQGRVGVGMSPTGVTGVNGVLVRAGASQSTNNLLEAQNSSGTALASISSSGAGSFAGLTSTGTAGLTVQGTAGTPNVTLASLGGAVNSTIGSYDRVIVANSSGVLSQVAASQLLNDNVWLTTGNTGTTSGGALGAAATGNYLGTQGATDLRLATNGTVRAIVSSTGAISTEQDITVNGVRVGQGGSTGSFNTAVGAGALNGSGAGGMNAAFGWLALGQISVSGSAGNTAMGAAALSNLQGGLASANNVAIGRDAGAGTGSLAQPSLRTANSSVFIGASTKAATETSTNEIVIGASATGLGSNSVVLGNASITQTLLRGTVMARGASGQTADLFQAQTWDGSTAATVASISTAGIGTFMGGLTVNGAAGANNVTLASLGGAVNSTIGAYDRVIVANSSGVLSQVAASQLLNDNVWLTTGNTGTTSSGALGAAATGNYLGTQGATDLRIATNGTVRAIVSSTGAISTEQDITVNGVTVGRGAGNRFDNTAVGANALWLNGTAEGNTGVGYAALQRNTSGEFNTALGSYAASQGTLTGSYNTMLGANAAEYLSGSSSNNIAVGALAGRLLAGGGSLTAATSSVFLGVGSRANADAETNQIVIGASAVGLGSNTAVLGNSSITATRLQGRVGIGANPTTASGDAQLQVTAAAAANRGLVIAGATSQSANLFEARATVAGSPQVTIGSAGAFSTAQDITVNGVTVGRGSGAQYSNTAVGISALSNSGAGSENSAFGMWALGQVRGGSVGNTAVGAEALSNLGGTTPSNNNTAIGNVAGTIHAGSGGAVRNANSSVFIGANTRAAADGQTNQIVIGANTDGLGSNSVVLGNTDITQTLLRGTVMARGASGQTADLFQAQTWDGSTSATVASISTAGIGTFMGGLTVNGAAGANNVTLASLGGAVNPTMPSGGFNRVVVANASGVLSQVDASQLLNDNVWLTTGNSTTTAGGTLGSAPTGNFIGTTGTSTAARDLSFVTGNVIRAQISATGALSTQQDITVNGLRIGRAGSSTSNIYMGSSVPSSFGGSNNIAIGDSVMQTGISAASNDNVGLGRQALTQLSGGSGNTALGAAALGNLQSGSDSDNVAVGYFAGLNPVGGGGLTASNSSVFLGARTRSANLTSTNEIVIGANAIGLGSNTAVLGNSSITATRLQGRVGIGMDPNTAAADAQLQVTAGAIDRPALLARGTTGQTANIFEVRNSTGGSLMRVAANGSVHFNVVSPAGMYLLDAQGQTELLGHSSGVLIANQTALVGSGGVSVRNNGAFAWSSGGGDPGYNGKDTFLYRDAAGVIAQYNGVNAQGFRVYNTRTSATNNEFGKLQWSGNTFLIGTEKGSAGGTARGLDLQTDGVSRLSVSSTGAVSTVQDIMVNGVRVGRGAFVANTNLALGGGGELNVLPLFQATTGTGNTALGASALASITTGSDNTAVGSQSLFNGVSTGSRNIAVGSLAGCRGPSGGCSNFNPSDGIYLGYFARGNEFSGTATNQIVIGSEAIAFANNSVLLGNANITATRLQGRVGVGVSPTGVSGVNGLLVRAGSSQSTNNLFEAQTWDGTTATTVASISSTGAGSFAGLTSTGTAGLTVQGTAGTPNVTLASLGGATANASVPTGWDRFVLADSTGQLSQVSTSAVVALNAWALGGNAGTTNGGTLGSAPTGNFIGTTGTDAAARDLSFVTGNVIRAQISTAGQFSTQQDMVVNGLTVGRGPSADANSVAIGSGALQLADISALGNTAVGRSAMAGEGDPVTGDDNAAFGRLALRYLSSGSRNTAIGRSSMTALLTGSNNTAVGYLSLFPNAVGSGNVGVGFNAGCMVHGASGCTGPLDPTDSVFIGSNAKGLVDAGLSTTTNQIVIGANTDGLGSNTAILGNSSITATRLQGRVGVGVSPTGVSGVNGLLVRAGASQSTNNLFEAQTWDGTAATTVASIGATGAGSFAGLTSTGTAGLTVQGTAGTANVTLASLGGTTANAAVPTGWDRFVLANSTGQLNQVSTSAVVALNAWALGGNAGTTNGGTLGSAPTGNFIGTTGTSTAARDLSLVTGNVIRAQISATGAISTQQDITVNGVRIGTGGTSASNLYMGSTSQGDIPGINNIAIGYGAMTAAAGQNPTLFRQNIALGRWGLVGLVEGAGNVAVGDSALSNLQGTTASSDNVGIGKTAGVSSVIGSGLKVATSSVFIGANTRSATDTSTNEIVIGANTDGLGSNTAILGNSNIALTRLQGRVGIGLNPTVADGDAQLQVTAAAVGNRGLVVRGANGQTASLFEARTFNGTTATAQVTIGSGGALSTQQDITVNGVRVGRGPSGDLYSTVAGAGAMQYANATALYNTAVGAVAMSGSSSTAVTGSLNSAFGVGALSDLGAGSQNSAFGVEALQAVTTGSDNTAIGFMSLSSMTGSRSVAIGIFAGCRAHPAPGCSNGLNADDSVFIGASAKGFNDAATGYTTNQIVIGANTNGFAHNSAILGNSSITATRLQGRVGVGVSPTGVTGVNGLLVRAGASQSTNNLFEAQDNTGTALASVSSTGAGTFAGLTSTGTAGLTVQGTAGTPNVTLASLGGATANAAVPTGWDRFVLANSTGQLSQVSTSAVVALNAWALGGNAGTTNGGTLGSAPTGNFIGTTGTDAAARDLSLVTGNVIRAQISATGALSTEQDITVNGVRVGRAGSSDAFTTAMGTNVLGLNGIGIVTASANSAFGRSALGQLRSGSDNAAFGANALANLQSTTDSSSNVAIGSSAGVQAGVGGGVSVANTSVFIGANTRPAASAQQNQIVIGDSAVGLGSNTAVLGNSNIALTRLQGRVGIGLNPTVVDGDAQLQVTAAAAANRGLVVRGANGQTASLFEARTFNGTTATAQVTIGSAGALSTAQDIMVNGVTVGRGAGGVSSNTAVGASALVSNGSIIPSTATNSVAIGTGAFRFLSQGADNVAVGVDAGSYEALSPVDTAVDRSSSIFIGARSFGPAASSNQIVIGTEAAGLGSNTAVFGNSSITATRLQGRVGIGANPTTAAGDAQLQVTAAAAANRGLVIAGAASQSANLFEARATVAGSPQVTIGSAGAFSTEQDITVNGLTVGRGSAMVASNTVVGVSALPNNGIYAPATPAASNTVAIGTGAFRFLNQGTDNVAVGVDAGSYETLVPIDGAGARSSSIFIGARSFGPAASSNQIVIGTEAAGLGSNTAVFGNSSITATRLQGRVGVGMSPTGATGVNGLLVRAGGSQSTNNLLEAQNNAGTALASIGSTGAGSFAGLTSTGTAGLTVQGTAGTPNVTLASLGGTVNSTIGSYDRVVVTNSSGVLSQVAASQLLNDNVWLTTGNTGTTSGGALGAAATGNYLGTQGATDLRLATNGTVRAIVSSTGAISTEQDITVNGVTVGRGRVVDSVNGRNTALGVRVLEANTTAGDSTGVGYFALIDQTTGGSNTAIGSYALTGVQGGFSNTAVGTAALGSLVSGIYNVGVGRDAGKLNTGSRNVFLGYSAGFNETGSNKLYIANDRDSNLIFGDFSTGRVAINAGGTDTAVPSAPGAALQVNITGSSATNARATKGLIVRAYDGSQSGNLFEAQTFDGTTGTAQVTISAAGALSTTQNITVNNVTVGRGAAGLITNTAVGISALGNGLTTGNNNSAFGRGTLASLTSGSENVAVGIWSQNALTTGYANTTIGTNAMRTSTTAWGNTAIGIAALENNLTGSRNVALGYQAGQNETGSNKLYIAYSNNDSLIYGDFSTGRLAINAGATPSAPGAALQVNARATNTIGFIVNGAAGQTANLIEAKVDGGSNLFSVSAAGNIAVAGALSTAQDITVNEVTVGRGAAGLITNTAVGISALANGLATGLDNSAFGRATLANLTTGSANVAVGIWSQTALTTGHSNTTIGANALMNSTTAWGNTAVGIGTLESNVTGTSNVALGFQAGQYETGSNKLYIANNNINSLIYGDFSTGRLAINVGGTATVLPSAPGAALQVNAPGTTTVGFIVNGAAGQTANLIEAKVNGGSNLFSVGAAGNTTVAGTLAVSGTSTLTGLVGIGAAPAVTAGSAQLQVTATAAANRGIVVTGAASQSGNLFEGRASDATTRFTVSSSGNIAIGDTSTGAATSIAFGNTGSGFGALLVKNATTGSQIFDFYYGRHGGQAGSSLRFWRDQVQQVAVMDGNGRFGLMETSPGARLQANTGGDAIKGIIVKGNSATQSANLFEAQTSAGSLLFSVNAAGNTAVAGTLTVQGTLSAPGAISTTTATATTSVITPLVTSTGGLVVNGGNAGSGSSLTLQTNTVDRFVINSSGDGIFGTVANPGSLSIATGAVAASGYKLDVGGNVKVTGDVVANGVTLTSDARLKTNVQAITDALAIVRKLQGVSYDWNRAAYPERGFSARPQIGVLAQQVEGVLPELVSTDASGFKSVNYTGFIPVLIEGMKQQADQLDAQGERLTKAEEKLGLVEERLFKAEEQFIKLDERVGKAESFVARFDTVSEPETMMVLTPTFKVQNFTADRAYIAELRAQRIEADKARFKELDADGAVIDNVEAARLRGRVVNTGGKDLFVSYGSVAPLFEAANDGHYIVSVSAEDGSYATAQVINAGGVLRVVPTASQGIEVVANGSSVGLVAPSKKVKASWTRTG